MPALQTAFSILDKVAPGISARLVLDYMSRPRTRKLRPFEKVSLDEASVETINYKGETTYRYEWGNPAGDIAFCMHGWEGQSGNFGGIVSQLTDKGYRVIAYDGPAHGRSSGRRTSMFAYAHFITDMFAHYQPSVIVSHSFGTVAGMYALMNYPEIEVCQWFAITTPFDFKDRINDIREILGVGHRTMNRLFNLIENRTGREVAELNMRAMGSHLNNVEEVIIVHSLSDKIIPIQDARRTAEVLPTARLIELDNVGHYAILWSPQLKEILQDLLVPSSEIAQ